jgi:hypothetical protein
MAPQMFGLAVLMLCSSALALSLNGRAPLRKLARSSAAPVASEPSVAAPSALVAELMYEACRRTI